MIHAEGMAHAAEALKLETELSTLWGQVGYAAYALVGGEVVRTVTGGGVTAEQTVAQAGDVLTVVLANWDIAYRTVTVDDPAFLPGDRYAVKLIPKAIGLIGGKEVAIEAKELMLQKHWTQWEKEMSEARREQLREQIGATEMAIMDLRYGTAESEGLYSLMTRAIDLSFTVADANAVAALDRGRQQEAENALAAALGDMLRDGYWSNTSYAPGQEMNLYLDALDIMAEVSRPAVSYTVAVQNLAMLTGYEMERFRLHQTLRIWDEALRLNDYAYVTKLVEQLDAPEKTSITISNEAMHVGGVT